MVADLAQVDQAHEYLEAALQYTTDLARLHVAAVELALLVGQTAEQHLLVLLWQADVRLDVGFHTAQQVRRYGVLQHRGTLERCHHLSLNLHQTLHS